LYCIIAKSLLKRKSSKREIEYEKMKSGNPDFKCVRKF